MSLPEGVRIVSIDETNHDFGCGSERASVVRTSNGDEWFIELGVHSYEETRPGVWVIRFEAPADS